MMEEKETIQKGHIVIKLKTSDFDYPLTTDIVKKAIDSV